MHPYLIIAINFLMSLSLLIVLHELGHFIPARLFKTRVEKFYLFFDIKYSLFKKKIGETVYGIGWLPLGGYVKIAGMVDESMDTEAMAEEPKPWEFRSKPAWQRLIIMMGGVTVNFFLSWIIYSALIFTQGDTYIPADSLKYGIQVDSIGEELGLRTGDQIIAIDGKKALKFSDAQLDIILGDNVTVSRDGNEITVPISDEGKRLIFETKGRNFIGYRTKAIIDQILPDSEAEKSGFQSGDAVTGINGKSISYWTELVEVIESSNEQKLSINVLRNGTTKNIMVDVPAEGKIGIGPYVEDLRVTDNYGFFASIPAGFNRTIKVLTDQVRQFKVIFNTKTGAIKQVKGPIGIVEMMSPTWDWLFFFNFLAMFSVWLAFVNLLPIPALDGGHVMFLLYEMISGRPPSQKVLENGQIVGFVILMGLMAVIFGNDIWNIVKRFL